MLVLTQILHFPCDHIIQTALTNDEEGIFMGASKNFQTRPNKSCKTLLKKLSTLHILFDKKKSFFKYIVKPPSLDKDVCAHAVHIFTS